MASGDTKTEAMLNALGNGGSADEFRGCCNTKTQQYILDAIDRVQNVEDEVEELKNNPDVVDIVDTYADLQAYDTTHLSDNDIIRVLADETHSGNSTYYKFNKQAGTWTFIGEIAGGAETVKTLTSADYNYPADNPNGLAPWLLDPGLYYTTEANMNIYNNSGSSGTSDGNAFYVARTRNGAKSVLRLVNQNWIYTDYTAAGAESTSYTLLGTNKIQQTTGTSTTDVMSQKAVTSTIFSDSDGYRVRIGESATTSAYYRDVAIGSSAKATGSNSVAVGFGAQATKADSVAIGSAAKANQNYTVSINGQALATGSVAIRGTVMSGKDNGIAVGYDAECSNINSVALGVSSTTARDGEVNVGAGATTNGYNSTAYRVIGGVHDGQNAHDAATKGQLDAISSYSETEVDTGATWIDGKTIYKKSYSQTITSNTQTFNLNITNLYEIVKIEAIWHTGGTLTNGLPTTFASTSSVTDTVTVLTYGGQAEITSSGRSGMKGVITFYYTKSS